ncbi:hypothetical protein DTL42_20155 [Bremerella cremea]|uniref:Uncharacterized protein n=1 Tax=Bremerella cremea TaxID=1031537 RepID=A0A368KLP7_9BACT|nr:hypothetical protein [Bremerella cremea]RCS42146.1 hypothetical protein DTL42_20155 [Bremerella cremea]
MKPLRFLLNAMLATLLTLVSHQEAPAEQPPQQPFVLTIRVLEQRDVGQKPVCVSAPSISAYPNRPFAFVSGGEIPSKFDDSLYLIGTRVEGVVKLRKDGQFQLEAQYTLGQQRPLPAATESEIFHNETVHFKTVLKDRESRTLQVSATRSYALKIETVSQLTPLKPDQPQPSSHELKSASSVQQYGSGQVKRRR